jgi:8-oxo-dGTP diphosphatase
LVARHSRLLITRRRAGDHLGGLWEFPGGKREAGESFEECLRRELMEELGIEIAILGLLESIDHDYPDKSVRLQFYRCRWRRNEPTAREGQELAWVTPGDLALYEFPAADAKLLAMLEASPELWR